MLYSRLEERVTQLQKKKVALQNRLGLEKRKIEELRCKLLEMEEREDDLCSKITKLEGLLQNYEQRNFELEETCIDMKCSIQFVLHSMPVFSLCYFWYHMRSLKGVRPTGFLQLFLGPQQAKSDSYSNSHHNYHLKALQWPSSNHFRDNSNVNGCSAVQLGKHGEASSVSVVGSRKHKLVTTIGAAAEVIEPVLKKLKSLGMIRGGNVCDSSSWVHEESSNKIINDAYDVRISKVERVELTHEEAQTGDEEWKIFMDEMILKHREEWEITERCLRKKIEVLECDIDLCQEAFDQERSRMIEMYEGKLNVKESELKETRQCQSQKQELQDKWNCLIQELEQFAAYLGRNLSLKTDALLQSNDPSQGSFVSELVEHGESIDAEMEDCSILEMRRSPPPLPSMPPPPLSPSSSSFIHINSNNDYSNALVASNASTTRPGHRRMKTEGYNTRLISARCNNDDDDFAGMEKTKGKSELIELLQSSLKEHLSKFESREQQLVAEIDRLAEQIKVNSAKNVETESNIVSHLTEENERLQALFKDHDKVWADVRRLQEENEKLETELSDTLALRTRLEDSQKNETELRERIEEVERSEATLKSQLAQMDRKEQKGQEKIQQLRDEIQFLRNKCCQLQDDIDARVARETKYKNEIQTLSSKLKETNLELEEKESQLEINEVALQTQARHRCIANMIVCSGK
jgi:hypothetical protein